MIHAWMACLVVALILAASVAFGAAWCVASDLQSGAISFFWVGVGIKAWVVARVVGHLITATDKFLN